MAAELRASRTALKVLTQAYGHAALANREAEHRTRRGFKIAQTRRRRQLRAAQARGDALHAQIAKLPKRVPVSALGDDETS